MHTQPKVSSSQGGRGSSGVAVKKTMRRAVPHLLWNQGCDTSSWRCLLWGAEIQPWVSAVSSGNCSVKDKSPPQLIFTLKNPKHLNCFSAIELLMGKKSVLWPLVTSLACSSTYQPLLYRLEAKAVIPLPEVSLISKIQILYQKTRGNSPKYGSFIF